MWEFVTSKDNPNVRLLLGLPCLWSVDVKLFIEKKEIFIEDNKKREAIYQILCSTTLFEDTRFQANSKNKANVNESSEEKNIDQEDGNSIEEESDDESSDQGY